MRSRRGFIGGLVGTTALLAGCAGVIENEDDSAGGGPLEPPYTSPTGGVYADPDEGGGRVEADFLLADANRVVVEKNGREIDIISSDTYDRVVVDESPSSGDTYEAIAVYPDQSREVVDELCYRCGESEAGTDGTNQPDQDPESDTGTNDESEQPSSPDHLAGLSGSTAPGEERGSRTESFSWQYEGSEYSVNVDIPEHLLSYYQDRERTGNDRGFYVSDPFDLDVLEQLALEIQGLADDQMHGVELTRAFVQQMPYSTDEVSSGIDQYARFPLETLANGGGDCEDTAILLSELLLYQGFETVLLGYFDQQHMALGLRGEESVGGTYFEARGNRYYYVETTASGWEVGEVPDSLNPSSPDLQWIDDVPVLVLDWVTRSASSGIEVRANVTNLGVVAAENVDIIAETQVRGGDAVANERSSQVSIPSNESHEFVVPINPPADREQRIAVQVGIDDYLHDKTTSEWRNPSG